MSLIVETMGIYQRIVLSIDLAPHASAEALITLPVVQQQGLFEIIQVVSNEVLGKITKLKNSHDM
jgi:hypothetical protein